MAEHARAAAEVAAAENDAARRRQMKYGIGISLPSEVSVCSVFLVNSASLAIASLHRHFPY